MRRRERKRQKKKEGEIGLFGEAAVDRSISPSCIAGVTVAALAVTTVAAVTAVAAGERRRCTGGRSAERRTAGVHDTLRRDGRAQGSEGLGRLGLARSHESIEVGCRTHRRSGCG